MATLLILEIYAKTNWLEISAQWIYQNINAAFKLLSTNQIALKLCKPTEGELYLYIYNIYIIDKVVLDLGRLRAESNQHTLQSICMYMHICFDFLILKVPVTAAADYKLNTIILMIFQLCENQKQIVVF